MKETNPALRSDDLDNAVHNRVLERAKAMTAEILARLKTVMDDLEAGQYRAALGGLDGIEAQLTTIRSILLLLP